MELLFWNPDEAGSGAYGTVKKHSKGMISFAYRPLSETDLSALKNTETYRRLLEEVGAESLGVTPGAQEAPNKG